MLKPAKNKIRCKTANQHKNYARKLPSFFLSLGLANEEEGESDSPDNHYPRPLSKKISIRPCYRRWNRIGQKTYHEKPGDAFNRGSGSGRQRSHCELES